MPDLSSSTSAAWNASNWFTFSPAMLFVLLNIVIGTIFLSSHFTPKRKPQEEGNRQPLVRAPSLIDRVKSINYSFRKHSPEFQDNGNTTEADQPLVRAPSLIDRVKSINYSFRKHSPEFQDNGNTKEADHQPVIQRDVPPLQRLNSVKLSSYRSESNAGEPEQEQEPEPEPQPERIESEEVPEHHHHRTKSEQRVTADRTRAARMKRWASEKAVKMEVNEEERERVERRRPETVRLGKTASFGDDEEGGVDAKADDFISKFKQQLKLQRLDSLLRYRDMFK